MKADTYARRPITENSLSSIILRLPGSCRNAYETRLFKAAFTLSFWGLFRVEEITVSKGNDINHVMSANDVHVDVELSKVVVFLRYSKMDQFGKGVTFELKSVGSPICTFNSMQDFLATRPSTYVPLFVTLAGHLLQGTSFRPYLVRP